MDLNTLWFILIAVLYTGYFVLEGFDMGVGILLPFFGKDDVRRRAIINTIGPHWDGNEVWLLTAGGATFAAFPIWYATLFSGFYVALFLMLVALIIRAVAFEFRSKDENKTWRKTWDWAIFFGSLIPALLWGVAFSNMIRGVSIADNFAYQGGFFELLNWYSILGGLVTVVLFSLHGAIFLSLKTRDDLQDKARSFGRKLWIPALVLLALYTAAGWFMTGIYGKAQITPAVTAIAALVTLGAAGWFIGKKRDGWAFILTCATILFVVVTFFLSLFPNVLVSSMDANYNLTITNSASGATTLKTMSIVALIFVPIVLLYQAWTYRVFRKRVVEKAESLHY